LTQDQDTPSSPISINFDPGEGNFLNEEDEEVYHSLTVLQGARYSVSEHSVMQIFNR